VPQKICGTTVDATNKIQNSYKIENSFFLDRATPAKQVLKEIGGMNKKQSTLARSERFLNKC
jgi:hypothetical protein